MRALVRFGHFHEYKRRWECNLIFTSTLLLRGGFRTDTEILQSQIGTHVSVTVVQFASVNRSVSSQNLSLLLHILELLYAFRSLRRPPMNAHSLYSALYLIDKMRLEDRLNRIKSSCWPRHLTRVLVVTRLLVHP